MNSLDDLKLALRSFADERDWFKYHTPKNLAMAIAGEAGELAAEFQWLTAEESANLTDEQRNAVVSEIADVLIYLVRLADELEVDLLECARIKHEENQLRF